MADLGLKLPRAGGDLMWTFERTPGEWGRRAEELGYGSVWAAEGWGANVFTDLTEIVLATEDLRVGTAIANVYSRSPAVLAMGAASLARKSGGRAVLGLGASHPGFVEGLHNVDYDRPVRRSHEAIELIRELIEGEEPVDYEGELFSVEGFEPLGESVPIYNAAMGEANRRATGRVADGWLPFLLPFSTLDDAFETVERAAREAGRDPGEITVRPQVLSAVHPDREVAQDPVREFVANYVGNFEAYRAAIAEEFPEAAEAVAAAWNDGEEAEAKARIPEAMLRELGVTGTPEEARDRLREVLDVDAVDAAVVYVPTGVPEDTLDRTMEALAPGKL